MVSKTQIKQSPCSSTRNKTGSWTKYARYLPITLGLFFLVYYFDILTGKAHLWEDIAEQAYPNLIFTVHSLKQGLFPFWTPYVFSGMPFFRRFTSYNILSSIPDFISNLSFFRILTQYSCPLLLPFIYYCLALVSIFSAGISE